MAHLCLVALLRESPSSRILDDQKHSLIYVANQNFRPSQILRTTISFCHLVPSGPSTSIPLAHPRPRRRQRHRTQYVEARATVRWFMTTRAQVADTEYNFRAFPWRCLR
jgi:hypothetical protein